jgi:cytochrome c oxidase cbb3-type subunit III
MGGKMYLTRTVSLFILTITIPTSYAQQGTGGRGGVAAGQSPAAQPPPATKTPESYSGDQIQAGESRFASQCGFCHGRDAQGGESGPDLTRSALVAEDMRGDMIGPTIRSGRPAKGMPAFSLSDSDMAAIVAFIHDAKTKAETESGGRRSVDVDDLQTGSSEAGKRYFNGSGGCAKCHSLAGSFATVGARFQGLALLQRMLYPTSGRGPGAAPVPPMITVTTAKGQQVTGKLAYRDEFTITLIDSDGWNRSWPIGSVKIDGEDPLRAHAEQLGRYTDEDIHDVFAYLQTLK